MKTVDQEVEHFKRLRIEEDLSECTSLQREFFGSIYPDGVPRADLDQAWALIKRTLEENERVEAMRTACDDANVVDEPIMMIGHRQSKG